MLNKGEYDLVVVSGDITMDGHVAEYEAAKVFLETTTPSTGDM